MSNPLVSVITPTHDPKFLKETIDSVIAQTYQNWEMVLVPNNGLSLTDAPDPRIRIIPFPVAGAQNIGQIKNFAFMQGKGEILVEVDHDDILDPTCLEKLVKAYEAGDCDFVYSQVAQFEEDFKNPKPRAPYSAENGWTYKTLPNGLVVMDQFELHPMTMSYIWFQPDHVRSFTKEIYRKIGGHDCSLSICDDQMLMMKMYLAGARFKEIKEPLYFYRVHGGNSWIQRNAPIQEKTVELRSKYLEAICLEWCKRKGLKAIDLGGGFNKPLGYTSVDLEGGDITADLRGKYPFEDNSVGLIRANDFLEHISDKMHSMREIHRVLAPGGVFLSMTPAFPGAGSVMDPSHISFWNEQSFWYFTRAEQAKYIKNTTIRFQEDRLCTVFPNEWCKQNNVPYVEAALIALKDGMARVPGIIRI